MDVSSKVVEVNEVLHNALVVIHVEILKVSLCFAFRVMQSEVVLQIHNEVRVVIKPGCVVIKYNEPSFIKKSIKTKELKTETRNDPLTTHTRT